eukprot:4636890-Amphidinium_carterae.1
MLWAVGTPDRSATGPLVLPDAALPVESVPPDAWLTGELVSPVSWMPKKGKKTWLHQQEARTQSRYP